MLIITMKIILILRFFRRWRWRTVVPSLTMKQRLNSKTGRGKGKCAVSNRTKGEKEGGV